MQDTMFRPGITTNNSDKVAGSLLAIAQTILVVTCGLFPILFLPISYAPFGYSKVLFVLVGVITAIVFYTLSILRTGRFALKMPAGIVAMWAVAVAALVSAYFSGDVHDALLGNTLGVHTAGFVCVLALVATSLTILRGSKTAVMRLYILLLVSALTLGAFHMMRLVLGVDFLTFGMFTTSTATPLGGWNDLALYFGLTILLALVAIEQLPLTKVGRVILGLISVFALCMLAVINFFAVWVVLAIVSLVVLMYSLTKKRFQTPQLSMEEESGTVTPIILSVVVLAVSLVFIVGGGALGGVVSNITGVSYVEVRPSFDATVNIMKAVYKENFLTGIGPNKFVDAWRIHKDIAINETAFWNTNFESGNGYITTAFVTNGLLGVVAWLFFLGALMVSVWRVLLSKQQADRFWRFVSTSSLVAVVYLWSMCLLFVPTVSVLVLAAICTGIFFTAYGVLVPQRSYELSAVSNKNMGFVFVGAVMVVIIGSVSALYFTGQHYAAIYGFNKTLATVQLGDSLTTVEQGIASAYQSSRNDVFALQIAGYQLAQMNALIGIQEPTAEQQQLFQTAAVNGINAAQSATNLDQSEPQNWIVLGQIYAVLGLAGVEGADDRARDAFENAKRLSPKNPAILLLLAGLAERTGDTEQAKALANESVAMKRNFTDGLFFLTQLDIKEGNIQVAADRARAIATLEQNNAARFYQLGVLESALNNVVPAMQAFRAAIALDPNYANARYFLAIALNEQGDTAGALEQLRVVGQLNPDNELVKNLISRLENGESITVTPSLEAPVENPEVVSEEDGQVSTTQDPDSNLLSPVNTVPEFSNNENEDNQSQAVTATTTTQ